MHERHVTLDVFCKRHPKLATEARALVEAGAVTLNPEGKITLPMSLRTPNNIRGPNGTRAPNGIRFPNGIRMLGEGKVSENLLRTAATYTSGGMKLKRQTSTIIK